MFSFGASKPAATISSSASSTPQSTSVPGPSSISSAAPTLTSKPVVTSIAPAVKPSTPASIPTPSHLRNRTMEEILNGWNAQLDAYTREFSTLADSVAQQDRALIENGSQITRLHTADLQTEQTQQAIAQNLDYIHS